MTSRTPADAGLQRVPLSHSESLPRRQAAGEAGTRTGPVDRRAADRSGGGGGRVRLDCVGGGEKCPCPDKSAQQRLNLSRS